MIKFILYLYKGKYYIFNNNYYIQVIHDNIYAYNNQISRFYPITGEISRIYNMNTKLMIRLK